MSIVALLSDGAVDVTDVGTAEAALEAIQAAASTARSSISVCPISRETS